PGREGSPPLVLGREAPAPRARMAPVAFESPAGNRSIVGRYCPETGGDCALGRWKGASDREEWRSVDLAHEAGPLVAVAPVEPNGAPALVLVDRTKLRFFSAIDGK